MPLCSCWLGRPLVERVKMDPSSGLIGVDAFTVSFMHPDPSDCYEGDCTDRRTIRRGEHEGT